MAVTVGSNISALTAQRRLGEASSALGKNYERLSSGQRINCASDDAAGLSIADSLKTKARLYGTAARNINDAISVTNLMASTLDAQQGILQRLQELAEQAANGVYSSKQRMAMQKEYYSLVQEFGRIAEATKFNGRPLMSGTRNGEGDIAFQAGIEGSTNSILNLGALDTGPMSGAVAIAIDYYPDGAIDSADYSLWDTWIGTNPSSFNDIFDVSGGALTYQEVRDSEGKTREVWVASYLYNDSSQSVELVAYTSSGNEKLQQVGILPLADLRSSQKMTLTFSDGAAAELNLDLTSASALAEWGLTKAAETVFEAAGDSVYSPDYAGLFIPASSWRKSCIDFTGVETVSRALEALDTVRNRMEDLSNMQGQIGAVQARLQTALNLAEVSRENSLAAESRIRDVDVASESSELTRSQIVQQAAAAVLAQANQQPQLALQLLRG